DPEQSNTAEHPSTYMPLDRCDADRKRRDRRANSRSRAQYSETRGADVQDVARKSRQQRRGTAKQDSEEIQRDRAEYVAVPEDEAQAVKQIRGLALGGRGRAHRPDRQYERDDHNDQANTRTINDRRTEQIQESPE